MSRLVQRLESAGQVWRNIEKAVLSVLVGGMILLAAVQIVLRNVFQSGLTWADQALGVAMLWLTMIGALVATGARKHISVDLAMALAPARWRLSLRVLSDLFAAGVCVLLARAALRFVMFHREMPGSGGLLGVPQWVSYMVMPVCFGLMSARFLLQAVWVALGRSWDGRD